MVTGVLASLGLKAIAPAVVNGYGALRRELARRVPENQISQFAGLEAQLEEAVSVLARDAVSPLGQAAVTAKAWISRPAIFNHPCAQAWIATERAQELVKQAALALLRGEDDGPQAEQALRLYALFLDDEEAVHAPDAAEVYAAALRYVQSSLERHFTVGDRTILQSLNGVQAMLGDLNRTLTSGAGAEFVDAAIERNLAELRQKRFFGSVDIVTEAALLADRLCEGNLQAASPIVRARALAWCARWLSASDLERARSLIARARLWTQQSLAELMVAEAFVVSKTDWHQALGTLSLEDPMQATAALQILRAAFPAADVKQELGHIGIEWSMLDAEGHYIYIAALLEAEDWAAVYRAVEQLGEEDYEGAPALLWIAATTMVAAGLSEDVRGTVLQGVPLRPEKFPLPERPADIAARNVAVQLLDRMAERCAALSLARQALGANRYALWLRLHHPAQRDQALETLRTHIQHERFDVSYLALGIAFGLPIDLVEARRRAERALARAPHDNADAVAALLAIFFLQAETDPGEAANLIDSLRDVLEDSVGRSTLAPLEIQALVNAGRRDKAEARLARLDPETLDPAMYHLLEEAVAGEPRPTLDALEALYAQGEPTHMLRELVARHREVGVSERYLELASRLIRTTGNVADAVSVIRPLMDGCHDDEAASLLAEAQTLLPISPELMSLAAWLHFRAGRIAEAEMALQAVELQRDDPNDRLLRLYLIVNAGRWPELKAFIERQWARRETLSAEEMARLGTLAAHVGSDRLPDIIFAAVEKDPDDPNILVAAYHAAVMAGLEDKLAESGQWLNKAARLSDESGLLQSASLDDILASRPQWEERVNDAYRHLAAGDVPLSSVAALLRRSWLELQLLPMMVNDREPAVHRRALVPLFSGKRGEANVILGQEIAVDRTALVTLAVQGLLKPVLQAFERVVVSHGTLFELFEHRQRLLFHQPSKVRLAERLVALLGRDKVKTLAVDSAADPTLVGEVGQAMARLLSEAARHEDGQHVVIHPFPLTRVGSLMKEEANLGVYAKRLASCSAVLDVLVRRGGLTQAETKRAREYFNIHDRAWPDEPRIEAGAVLYLSDLSVDYLRFAGLLEKLDGAGLKVILSPSEVDEARSLIDYQHVAEDAVTLVDEIANTLAEGIAAERVVLDRARTLESEHDPTLSVAWLCERSAIVICDDRFVNRYEHFEHAEGLSRILTSCELIELLTVQGRIDLDIGKEVRTRLRLAGVSFVPVSLDELTRFLDDTIGEDGCLLETAELRAVRESIRLIQIRGYFQPEHDTSWLMAFNEALVSALIAQWNDTIENHLACARADWLMRLLSIADWSDNVPRPFSAEAASFGQIMMLSKVLIAAMALDGASKIRFAEWIERSVLNRLWDETPDLKRRFLEHFRGVVISLGDFPSESLNIDKRTRIGVAFAQFPNFLQLLLIEDDAFREELGLEVGGSVTIGIEGPVFDRHAFFDTVERLYSDEDRTTTLADDQGRNWTLKTSKSDIGRPITMRRGKQRRLIRGIYPLHPNGAVRLAAFDAEVERSGLPAREFDRRRILLGDRVLSAGEIDALTSDLAETPASVFEAISASVEQGEASISLLVPQSKRYFERLTGGSDSNSVLDHAENIIPSLAVSNGWDHSVEGVEQLLLLASHPSLLKSVRFDALSDEQWITIGEWVKEGGDLLAKVGFVEIAMTPALTNSELERCLMDLVEEISALDPEDDAGRLHYFMALVVLTDGELSQNGLARDWSPYRRRIASFAQAAMIERATWGRVDTKQFAQFCISKCGWRFLAQNLVDLQREPRWRPDFLSPSQLKYEVLGRLFNRANAVSDQEYKDSQILSRVLDADKGVGVGIGPMAFWPGPIEGATDITVPDPSPELVEVINDALADPERILEGLNGVINASVICRLPPTILDAVVDVLRTRSFFLATHSQSGYHIGLACAAASHRHQDLANQIAGMVRHMRVTLLPRMSAEEDVRLGLILAAAKSDRESWADFIGSWMRELVSVDLDVDRAQSLQLWIDMLCAIEPMLLPKTGRAQAVLKAKLKQ